MDGSSLPYWHAMHTTAIVAQCFSFLGSGTIIALFFTLGSRRKLFHYEVLFINIADLFWVAWHFMNHVDALLESHVTHNRNFCTAMGMFTHLGIGWELMWLMCIATHTAYLFYRTSHGVSAKQWDPSKRTKTLVMLLCWGFPLIWWIVLGISTDSYESTGYYCWVRIDKTWRPWVLADGPLLFACVYISVCYSYVLYHLASYSKNKKLFGTKGYSSEMRHTAMYIIVVVAWVHPYLAVTLMAAINGSIDSKFWLYFLLMVNSLGTLNFVAYGFQEGWWRSLKARITGASVLTGSGSDSGSGTASNRNSARLSVQLGATARLSVQLTTSSV